MKRTIGTVLALGVLGAVLAGCSTAGATQPAGPTTTTAKPSHSAKPLPDGETRLNGTVASVSPTQLVVTKKDGSTETVTTDASTKITGGPLQQGQHVGVIVKDSHALSVRVATPKQSTTATPTPTS